MEYFQPAEQYAQQSPEEYAATLAKKQALAQQQQGFQRRPMMQNPQMNMPTPELSFEQWKQMQMGQQMPQQQYGQPQNMDPNGMAIGPGGQRMTVQQLQQMKAQNPNRFGSIS